MKLLSLFGLDARIRGLRIAASEGALAAEDRVQLLRTAWEEEKQRYKQMLLLVIAVLGLTTVAVALLSVAIVVHFWDTPNRIAAAWSVAALWIVLWVIAMVKLMQAMNGARTVVAETRREFERDWEWARHRFGLDRHDGEERPERPATREELLARIERQRLRIMTLEAPDPEPAPGALPDESAGAAALRIAREHPVATGVAAAAVVAVLGPRRLIRWGAVIAPIVWRMR
ncbi:phage holin family protein [Variovorax robiniae]|uniref:Phage holin family protein n=1 Tax=Variovorax robiniae TaxID=1836199 RepID=A0ABU8XI41_9BURK